MKRKRTTVSGNLHTDGFIVLQNKFHITDELIATIEAQSDHTAAIFNHNENTAHNDFRRRQTPLRKNRKCIINFLAEMRDLSYNINKNLTMTDPVIIKSLAGCQSQSPHSDYIPDQLASLNDEQMPLSLLVAIQDGTKLLVWAKAIRLATLKHKVMRKTVNMNKGDAVIFRGDLVHAGADYSSLNIRIHAYLDSPMVDRTKNTTWTILDDAPPRIRSLIT